MAQFYVHEFKFSLCVRKLYKDLSVSIFAVTVDSVILDVVDSDKLKGVLEDDDDELTGPLLDSGSEEEDIGRYL